jgi:hypothetical protein
MNGETQNLRLEISGMYHKATDSSTYHRRLLRDSEQPRDFLINVENSDEPVTSYLYVFLGEYTAPSSIWGVKFNGNAVVEAEHSSSVGGSPRGDGRLDLERQTIFFDVTGMVHQGENALTITDIASPTNPYNFDGAILLNFYSSDEEHQYWLYHGVEYLENIDRFDAQYEINLIGVQNPSNSESTLSVVYHNGEQEHDALYINDVILRDMDAAYLLDGSHILAKSFSVSNYVGEENKVTFSMERYQKKLGGPLIQYQDNPIYPSILVLDVKHPPKPKIVVLANTIDYEASSDFFSFLRERNMKIIHSTAEDFEQYKDQKFIVILGGPDAPEGIGEIVKDSKILAIDDADYVRKKGNKRKFDATNPWGKLSGQVVWILAGSKREETHDLQLEHRLKIIQKIESSENSHETPAEAKKEPCQITPNNQLEHVLKYSEVKERGPVYICEVIYSGEEENRRITLYNQGEDEINLAGYKIYDKEDRFYKFSRVVETIIDSGGYKTLYSSELYPDIRLLSGSRSLVLVDTNEDLLDKVEWTAY